MQSKSLGLPLSIISINPQRSTFFDSILKCDVFIFSAVVKGVVCKKNVAHRRMTAKFDRPCLLILGGALEYERVSDENLDGIIGDESISLLLNPIGLEPDKRQSWVTQVLWIDKGDEALGA